MAKKRTSSHSAPRGARLGQHFLVGTWAARTLVNAADIRSGDMVLEIGPGKGALTKELLRAGARIIAVEKDAALVDALRSLFPQEVASGKLALLTEDIRSFDPAEHGLRAGNYILAANIPYYITGEILRQFLTVREQPRTAALLVQKEVADRIVARSGKESVLSLSVKCFGVPSIAAVVKRGNFSPPPAVDSAILVIKNISRGFFADVDEGEFFEVVRTGFASKRKLLLGNLAKKYGRESSQGGFAVSGLPKTIRAEDVPLEKWKRLAQHLVPR